MDKINSTKLKEAIEFMKQTSEDEWCVDIVRTKDEKANCLFGHLFNMGSDEKESNAWWNWFEENIATTYMIYPVNDGTNKKYNQITPKQRCIAYMEDLLSGKELTTPECMDMDYENWKNSNEYKIYKQERVTQSMKEGESGK